MNKHPCLTPSVVMTAVGLNFGFPLSGPLQISYPLPPTYPLPPSHSAKGYMQEIVPVCISKKREITEGILCVVIEVSMDLLAEQRLLREQRLNDSTPIFDLSP